MLRLRFLTLLLLAVTVTACVAPAQPVTTSAPANASTASAPVPASATAPASQEQPAAGGTITRALTSEPSGLDPHGPAGSAQNVILPYLFDTLVYRDQSNAYQPFLATKWDVAPDGKSVTFTLRDDVKFTDGTRLDAEAVKFTFERFKEKGGKSPVAPGILDIAKIEAIDPTTVRFYFDRPSSIFFSTVSMPYSGIISPAAVRASGDDFAHKPVGSGPFMIGSWQPGVSVTLVRNPGYKWGPAAAQNQGAPHVERLVFKTIPDAGSQLTALQAGDVDMIFVNSPGQIARLRKDKNINLQEATLNSLVYLGFNVKKAPFDDVRVRQALSHAVNKQEIITTALGGVGQEAFAPLAATLPGFDSALKQYEMGFDLARAKSLLAEAGFTPGSDGTLVKGQDRLSAVLVTSTRAPNESIATVLQSQLKAIGVQVEIKQLDATAAQEAMTKGDYGLMLWRYDWNDADVLYTYLSSTRIGRTNRNFYANKQVDDLLERALHETNDAARKQLYVEAQKLIMADAPWQPLYTPVDVMAIRTRVQDVIIGAMGRAILNNARVTGQ